MISTLIRDLLDGETIAPSRLEDALHVIMQGQAEAVQVAGLLVALAGRPVQAPLLAAAARALRAHRHAISPQVRPLIDTCGTGGDGAGTFNISTACALVVAASGAAVAKHGNRGVSSKVGSADVLEAAGAQLDLSPDEACGLLDATGFTFLFAPRFHPAMAHVAPVRRSLGVRTLFNLLGPLANPALAEFQLLGVYDPGLTETIAETLRELGSKGAMVVHCEGLDEIGLHAPTHGHRLTEGRIEPLRIDPGELGIEAAPIAVLQGGEAAESAGILEAALGGGTGAHSDVVALNAAAALQVGGRVPDLAAGLEEARSLMQRGSAKRVLTRFCEATHRAVEGRRDGSGVGA